MQTQSKEQNKMMLFTVQLNKNQIWLIHSNHLKSFFFKIHLDNITICVSIKNKQQTALCTTVLYLLRTKTQKDSST